MVQSHPPPQALLDEWISPQKTNSLENFLDVLEAELQFRQDGNKRKTDVLIYQGYEHTRDRLADKQCPTQYWHCRHKHKYKCKARLTLRVTDLEDITRGAAVDNFTPHCHPPYRMKSYGTTNVSALHTTDGSEANITADVYDSSNHVISGLSEGELERDFNQDILDAKACSSPAEEKRSLRRLEDDASQIGAGGGSSVEITTLMLDTSQIDARGYPFKKFIECKRKYKEQLIAENQDGGGTSSDQ